MWIALQKGLAKMLKAGTIFRQAKTRVIPLFCHALTDTAEAKAAPSSKAGAAFLFRKI